MGIKTNIEWTDASVNFWKGCRKVSQGCKNCYMFTDQKRYGQDPNAITRCKDTTFYAALKWTEPKKIFTCSWSDFFIEEADQWREDAWDVIRRTPQHTWQILTKRPERIADHLPPDWGDEWPNVWLGTSVEDQKAADERIPHLLNVPARVRFLSCEPLLGSVELRSSWLYFGFPSHTTREGRAIGGARGIHWVIAGGESGPNARPMHPDWARGLRDQCVAEGVQFLFKQWGEWVPRSHADELTSKEWGALSADGAFSPFTTCWNGHDDDGSGEAMMLKVGKKAAGRLLDGRAWDELPEVAG